VTRPGRRYPPPGHVGVRPVRARSYLRLGAVAALVGAATLVGVATAASRPTAVPVTLSVDESSPTAGEAVVLTARTKHLPHGDVVVIRLLAQDGTSETIRTCHASPCAAGWSESAAGSARFDAFVLTKAKTGRTVGRSAVVQVTWAAAPKPPPPPPAPPAALDGHYCGLSNEGKSICFDVTGGSGSPQAVANLYMESNVTCGDGSGWWWSIWSPLSSIDPSTLSFTYDYSGPHDATGVTNTNTTYTISGKFDSAGNASGTVWLKHISWDQGSTHYDCAGVPRTWTARLGA
jgi:hypothetical protein